MLKKSLGKILLLAVLEVGAICGVPISPEEIERTMRLNSQPEMVQVDVKDDDS